MYHVDIGSGDRTHKIWVLFGIEPGTLEKKLISHQIIVLFWDIHIQNKFDIKNSYDNEITK